MIDERILGVMKRLDRAIYTLSILWEKSVGSDGYPFELSLNELEVKVNIWVNAAFRELANKEYIGYKESPGEIRRRVLTFDALLEVKDAFFELCSLWEIDAFNENQLNYSSSIEYYPFSKCFNEITADVIEWVMMELPKVA